MWELDGGPPKNKKQNKINKPTAQPPEIHSSPPRRSLLCTALFTLGATVYSVITFFNAAHHCCIIQSH